MPDGNGLFEPDDSRGLAERALRAVAAAQERWAESETAQRLLATAVERTKRLQSEHVALWADLQRTIAGVALQERVAGRKPEQMLVLLKEIVDGSGLDIGLKREIEPDVMRWGIDAYYAA